MHARQDQMRHDFGGAQFDLQADRAVVGWVLNQLLFAEVAGVENGHWLERAPDVEGARFVTRRTAEALAHVDLVLESLRAVGGSPQTAHPMTRLVTHGLRARSWNAHLAQDVALGQALRLTLAYALLDTVPQAEVQDRLEELVADLQAQVAFGERRTLDAIAGRPLLRRRLLGGGLAVVWMLQDLQGLAARRVPAHPVLGQVPAFLETLVQVGERRLTAMGLLDRPLAALGARDKAARIAESYLSAGLKGLVNLPDRVRRRVGGGGGRLSRDYLDDPQVRRQLFTVIPGGGSEAA